jgi:hypothetical protein
MSVRFDAAESYNATLTLGSQANYTFSCWAKVSVDRNNWSAIWSFDQNMDGTAFILQTDSDGTTVKVYDDNVGNFIVTGPNVTVGTWYYFCVAVAGTSGTLYYRAATTQTLSTATWTGAARTITRILIGDDRYTEFLNGCVAGFKFWTAGLTAAEVAAESQQYMPQRWANLQSFHPFIKAETADYSGLGHTLSGGATTTTEDGPPIPWRMASPRLILPVATSGGVAEIGTTPLGIAASGIAEKVAVSSGPATVGLGGAGTAKKVAAVSGTCSLGLGSTGTAAKHAPVAGPVAAGLASAGRASKKAPQVGAVPLGLAATRAEVAARAQTGTLAAGFATVGTAAKKTAGVGVAPIGLAGVRSGVVARAVSGVCTLGLGAAALPRKAALAAGTASLGGFTAALPRKRATGTGAAGAGLLGRGTAAKRAPGRGATSVGVGLLSQPAKTSTQRGNASLGLVSTHLAVIVPKPIVRCGSRPMLVWDAGQQPDLLWDADGVRAIWSVDP